MALATVRPRLIKELPTKDTVPEVSRASQETDEASPSPQEEDEVSQASLSGGASGDHDIAPQPDRPSLTNDELSSEPVTDIIKRSQETEEVSRSLQEEDKVSKASLSGGDSQLGGAAGNYDIAPQPNQPPLTDDELCYEPVVDNIRRFQEADEVSRALLSGGDSQSGGAPGDYDIVPQPD